MPICGNVKVIICSAYDGSEIISGNWEGTVDNPIDLGTMAGNEIKEKIDDSFFKKKDLSY